MILLRTKFNIKNHLEILSLFVMLGLILSATNVHAVNFETNTKLALKELQTIDNEYLYIKDSGRERIVKFYKAYRNTIPLAAYFGSLDNIPAGPKITYPTAFTLTNNLLTFARPEQIDIIRLNKVTRDKSLYRSYMLYSIGILRALEKLEYYDLKNYDKIKILKNRIIRNTSQFLNGYQNLELEDQWEVIYFNLIQTYNTDFDAEIVELLSRQIVNLKKNSKLSELELKIANNLLLEITMICFSKCATPSFKTNSFVSYNLNTYLKNIAELCYIHCKAGLGWNPHTFGFYRSYLSFLKGSTDLDYEKVKSEIVFKTIKSYYYGSLFSFNEMIKSNSLNYFKDGVSNFIYVIILTIAYMLHYAPSYIILLIIAFILMTYFGKDKLFISKVNWIEKKLNLKNFIIVSFYNFKILINWIVKFSYDSAHKFCINTWQSVGSNEKIYSIAFNMILIAITLAISNLYSYIDKTF